MIIPDKKKAATVIIAQMHNPSLEIEEEEENDDEEECSALGEELLAAVSAKDPMGVYNALRAIFQKVDSEPHVEGEHEEDEGEEEY